MADPSSSSTTEHLDLNTNVQCGKCVEQEAKLHCLKYMYFVLSVTLCGNFFYNCFRRQESSDPWISFPSFCLLSTSLSILAILALWRGGLYCRKYWTLFAIFEAYAFTSLILLITQGYRSPALLTTYGMSGSLCAAQVILHDIKPMTPTPMRSKLAGAGVIILIEVQTIGYFQSQLNLFTPTVATGLFSALLILDSNRLIKGTGMSFMGTVFRLTRSANGTAAPDQGIMSPEQEPTIIPGTDCT